MSPVALPLTGALSIWNLAGGGPETNQVFVRLLILLEIEAKIVVNVIFANEQALFFNAILQDDERATLQRLLSKLIEHHEIGTVPIQ